MQQRAKSAESHLLAPRSAVPKEGACGEERRSPPFSSPRVRGTSMIFQFRKFDQFHLFPFKKQFSNRILPVNRGQVEKRNQLPCESDPAEASGLNRAKEKGTAEESEEEIRTLLEEGTAEVQRWRLAAKIPPVPLLLLGRLCRNRRAARQNPTP